MEGSGEIEPLLDDGDEHVNRDRDPDLGFYSVLGSAEEALDPEMLFDPLEKEFDLPAALVERANGQRRELKLVREEDKRLRRCGIPEADPAELLRVVPAGTETVEHNRLVADHSLGPIGRCRVDTPRIHVFLGPDDEESPRLGKRVEPFEI